MVVMGGVGVMVAMVVRVGRLVRRRWRSVHDEREVGGGRVSLLVEGVHALELGAKKGLLRRGFRDVVDEGGHERKQHRELALARSDGGEELVQAGLECAEVAVAENAAGLQRDDAACRLADGDDGGGGGEREDGRAVLPLQVGRSLGRRVGLRDLRSRRLLIVRPWLCCGGRRALASVAVAQRRCWRRWRRWRRRGADRGGGRLVRLVRLVLRASVVRLVRRFVLRTSVACWRRWRLRRRWRSGNGVRSGDSARNPKSGGECEAHEARGPFWFFGKRGPVVEAIDEVLVRIANGLVVVA